MIESKEKSLINSSSFWQDELFDNYYNSYYSNLNPGKLDKEFTRELGILVKTLHKLPDSERKALIQVLSRFVEFYMNSLVEKEIDSSFHKLFKF